MHSSVTGRSDVWFSDWMFMILIYGSVTGHSSIWFNDRTSGCMVHDIDTWFSNRTFRYVVQ